MKQKTIISLLIATTTVACGGSQKSSNNDGGTTMPGTQSSIVGPTFSADSAFAFCQQQCDFGPRTMNSEAHERCGAWIVEKFRQYGLHITEQRATAKGYDGTPLLMNNIIASYRPECNDRILICAHWDSRPWADNDPDPANHTKPVMAANDGASGVAVMIELARLLSKHDSGKSTNSADNSTQNAGNSADNSTRDAGNSTQDLALPDGIGIDFVCFDAEDWGKDGDEDSWALGAQHWAHNPHKAGYKARYGILLDMVGGQGARFYREAYSVHYARQVVDRVWQAAETAGYSSFFPKADGGGVTDDHGPVNEIAKIPCIDIIPFYPDCSESNFGPTWHTVKDDMQHIDPATLRAVGQTLVQVLWSQDN